jgi:nitroreductase
MFTERWSPRAFTGEAIDAATLLGFLEAARWAPSASNIQPWRFVYGLKGTPAGQAILDGLVPFNQTWAQHASALVVVMSATHSVAPGKTESKPNAWHAFDSGSAWMSLALAAHGAGWATHGMGGFVDASLRAALAVPEGVVIHAVVAVGKRGDPASLPEGLREREQPSDRLPLAQIVAEGRCNWAR